MAALGLRNPNHIVLNKSTQIPLKLIGYELDFVNFTHIAARMAGMLAIRASICNIHALLTDCHPVTFRG